MASKLITAKDSKGIKRTWSMSRWAKDRNIANSCFHVKWYRCKGMGMTDQEAIDAIPEMPRKKKVKDQGAPLTKDEIRYNATIRPLVECFILGRAMV